MYLNIPVLTNRLNWIELHVLRVGWFCVFVVWSRLLIKNHWSGFGADPRWVDLEKTKYEKNSGTQVTLSWSWENKNMRKHDKLKVKQWDWRFFLPESSRVSSRVFISWCFVNHESSKSEVCLVSWVCFFLISARVQPKILKYELKK